MDFLAPLQSMYSTASSWLVDDTMVMSARAGVSIGPDVYDQMDSRMTHMPKNVMVAYEQALYFVALAARRAMRNNEPAVSALLRSLDSLQADADAVSAKVNWICTTTGVACPSGGSANVLQQAIDAVEHSGINLDDRTQICAVLKANRRAVQFRQVLPVLAAVGVGALAGTWWLRRRGRK